MDLVGLNKQINKANQNMYEKITGAGGTQLDNEFTEMERRTDVFNELVIDLQQKTMEYLHPDPKVRAKISITKLGSKLSGQEKDSTYHQQEWSLGNAMSNYGRRLKCLDQGNIFASALTEMGHCLKQIGGHKYVMDYNVKQHFLMPLHHIESKDLPEVFHNLKKLHGQKLNFDYKKRVQERKKLSEVELKREEVKFGRSLQTAQDGMHNLLDGRVLEHICQLLQFAEALLEYHKNCSDILKILTETLHNKIGEASDNPKQRFTPKMLEYLGDTKNE